MKIILRRGCLYRLVLVYTEAKQRFASLQHYIELRCCGNRCMSIERDMRQTSRLIYNVRIRNTVETLVLLQMDYQPL